MKYYSNPGYVDTFDAISDSMLIGKSNVVVPYINVLLLPGNPIVNNKVFVDYSYYAFIGVSSMVFAAEAGKFQIDVNFETAEQFFTEHITIGGYKSPKGAEVEIKCGSLAFYFPDDAKFSANLFLHKNTPLFSKNLVDHDVNSFFSLSNLPNELKNLLGEDVKTLTWL